MKFGTDGVRGRFGTDLTLDDVSRLGRAAATVLGGGEWLVARDPRESGPAIEQAFVSGLRCGGATPTSMGVLPTPALAGASERLLRPAAMITASHNPYHDNGVKIFAPGGLKLADEIERAIESALTDQPVVDFGPITEVIDESAAYGERLVGLFPAQVLAGLRVVLDCANGSMSAVAPTIVGALGADVTVIHASPDGRNINHECGATVPASLAAAVVARGADLGLAFDGDGDRVIAVDHDGRVIDGDRLIALAALQLLDAGELIDDTVVVTVMSNLGFHKAMAAAGITVVATAVGDRYVLEALDSGGWSIGGEQSGHIIYRRLATTGDGLLAGLRLASFMQGQHRPLADLAADVMTSYPQVLLNVEVADRHPRAAEELATEIAAAEHNLAGDGRVLVRASGTEPLIRVMVEAATPALAQSTAQRLAAAVKQRFG
jgi:phosphoglucosamine mutase